MAVTGDITHGRNASATNPIPNPASPMTKLASAMMRTVATKARVTSPAVCTIRGTGRGRIVSARGDPDEPLAQMVEHLTFNQGVLGSIPRRLTKQLKHLQARSFPRAL